MKTIYIPVSVEKELPPYGERFTFICDGKILCGKIEKDDPEHIYNEGEDYYYALKRFSHWLKPVEITGELEQQINSLLK